MNIFYLSADPVKATEYHCDRHVVKMVLETAQLLSTSFHELGVYSTGMYQPTHVNHPCAIWVRESSGNLRWTIDLFSALLTEYRYRYGKDHASGSLELLFELALCDAMDEMQPGTTPPAQAMPEEYRDPDPVVAYRRYYCAEKSRLFSYRKRPFPSWIKDYPQ